MQTNYETSDELQHYGVLGMKWGVRRARKNNTTYTYTSMGTKQYAKKAEKYRKAGDKENAAKYEKYHKRSVKLDRMIQNNAERVSTGRQVVKMFTVTGFGGNRTYETVKSMTGNSKYISRGMAAVAACTTGPFGAIPARALYVRGVDNKSVSKDAKKFVSNLKK